MKKMTNTKDAVDELLTSIDMASQRLLELSEMKRSLKKLQIEMSVSAAKSKQLLEEHFCELKSQICHCLDQRLATLLAEVTLAEAENCSQLKTHENGIQLCMDDTQSVMDNGKSLLKNEPDEHLEEIKLYKTYADKTLSARLLESSVNDLTARVTVDLCSSVLPSISELLNEYGTVITKIPVLITSVEHRPGGLLLTWAEAEEEDCCEMSEFRLQMSSADSAVLAAYCDIYIGSLTSYQVRGLKLGQRYSFRVAGRAESSMKWSPWSDVVTSTVILPHHEWSESSAGYVLQDENTLATLVTSSNVPQVIYSKAASYICGHQMSFRIDEAGINDDVALIGLCCEAKMDASLRRHGAVSINMKGKVFVDGQEMVTRLPVVRRGSTVTLLSEVVTSGKVRVTIETEEKVVTLDWKLDSGENVFSIPGTTEVGRERALYFGACFSQSGWSVRVE